MADTTLADRMKHIADKSGMTKTAFAASLGITRNYLHTVLSGKSTGISETLALLIEAKYGYPSEWILTGEIPGNHPLKDFADKIYGLDKEDMRKLSAYIDELKGDKGI